jgi:hypothetical protein
MRGWEVILVPLIALAVAILASIFRGAEEVKRRQQQRGGGGPDSRSERARPEGSGIDQFLEEIRRRQAARQAPRETRRPGEEPPPAEPSPPLAPPPPRRDRVPEAPIVIQTVPVPSAPVPVLLDRPVLGAPPPAEVVTRATPAVAALRAQLAGIFKTRQGLQTAFLLREILSEPKSRRPR